VAALAATQCAHVTAAQLHAAGLSAGAIALRVRRGRLHRVHRGVYTVGLPNHTMVGAWMAAVLACGEGALLSHESAAQLWAVSPRVRSDFPHVTVPDNGRRHRRPRIALHRSRHLPPGVVARHRGIPVTSPERTVIDLAELMSQRMVERMIDEADR
jgi:hypothetical protein